MRKVSARWQRWQRCTRWRQRRQRRQQRQLPFRKGLIWTYFRNLKCNSKTFYFCALKPSAIASAQSIPLKTSVSSSNSTAFLRHAQNPSPSCGAPKPVRRGQFWKRFVLVAAQNTSASNTLVMAAISTLLRFDSPQFFSVRIPFILRTPRTQTFITLERKAS